MRQRFSSPGVTRSLSGAFEPHFNHSVGREVGSMRELRSAFHELSDRASARTGLHHDFKPLDPREVASHREDFGVSKER